MHLNRVQVLLFIGLIACIGITIALWNNSISNNTSLLTLTHSIDLSSYDPASYGLPNTIDGYKVIAAIPAEKIACAPSGTMKLVLENTPNLNSDIFGEKSELTHNANRLHVRFVVSFVAPGTNLQGIVPNIDKWNLAVTASGCHKVGPIVTLTPVTQ